MKNTRLAVTLALISVMVSSIFAYSQFNAQATNLQQICPPSGCPHIFFPPGFKPKFTYTVKFLCNAATTTAFSADAATIIGLEPGFYSTDINIHNPSFQNDNATIVQKFVEAEPENFVVPPAITTVTANPSPYVLRWAKLGPDAAMRFGCSEIVFLVSGFSAEQCASSSNSLLCVVKGFLVIYSETGNLDVWAEYTASLNSKLAGGTDTTAPTIDIVTIQPEPFTP